MSIKCLTTISFLFKEIVKHLIDSDASELIDVLTESGDALILKLIINFLYGVEVWLSSLPCR